MCTIKCILNIILLEHNKPSNTNYDVGVQKLGKLLPGGTLKVLRVRRGHADEKGWEPLTYMVMVVHLPPREVTDNCTNQLSKIDLERKTSFRSLLICFFRLGIFQNSSNCQMQFEQINDLVLDAYPICWERQKMEKWK